MRSVRIFVSSPSDVEHERLRVERVAERLNGELKDSARFTVYRWDKGQYYSAAETFQAQIPETPSFDLVIGILGHRLGSDMPRDWPKMPSGKPYPSGTAYELLTAIAASAAHKIPDVYIFKKLGGPALPDNEKEEEEVLEQWKRLKTFWGEFIQSKQEGFKAGFENYATIDELDEKLEGLLRHWLETKGHLGRALPWPIATKGSPFRGLAAFGAKHAPVFFGRSRDITKAIDVLKDAAERGHPFLLLLGPSGSGKSSLARAGLSPRLTTPGVVGAVDRWRVALVRPGEQKSEPLLALATRLFDAPGDIPSDEEGRPPALPELGDSPHKTPSQLAGPLGSGDAASVVWALDAVAEAVREHEGYDRRVRADLLLIVDQLDELFASDVSDEQRETFAKALAALVATGRVWVIATLRTDLYERLQQTPALLALKQKGGAYDLAAPSAVELAEIVRKPAEAAGLTYERKEPGKSLDEQLLDDAGRPDMLPLVQFALAELFDRRAMKGEETLLTFAAYAEIGGLDGAVDKRAEAALAGLGEAERASLPRLLRQLAVPARERGGVTLAIRPVPVADAAPDEASKRLVQALIDARILLSSGEEGAASVRLAHERVLKSWKRASDIVRDNADFYRMRDDVEDQLIRWRAADKSNDLLIPSGLPLEEARKLVAGYGAELDPETKAYVDASLAADDKRVRARRLRYRLAAAAAVLFAVLAVVAAGAGWQAMRAQHRATMEATRAEHNFAAAKDTVDSLIFNIAQGLRHVEGMRVGSITKILTTVQQTVEQLSATSPDSLELQDSRAAMFDEFTTTYLDAGNLQAAEQSAKQSLDIRRHLAEVDQRDPTARQHGVSFSLLQLGDVKLRSGDKAAALANYDQSLAIRRRLVELDPNNMGYQWDLEIGLERIGDIKRSSGDAAGALAAYEQEVAISRKLNSLYKDNTGLQNSLGFGLMRIGDVKSDRGDKAAALAAYQEALDLRRHLAEIDKVNTEWKQNLAFSLSRIGDLNLSLGNKAAAVAAYEESLGIYRKLANTDEENTAWQEDLATGLVQVGDAKKLAGDKPGALSAYEESLAIRQHLVETDKSNAVWQQNLAVSLERIGNVKVSVGDSGGALAAYEQEVAILRELLKTDNTNTDWQGNLAYGLVRIGDVKRRAGDRAAALAAYEENLAIRRHLVDTDKDNAAWQRELGAALERIGDVKISSGDNIGALEAYAGELAIFRRVVEINKDNADWQRDLSVGLIRFGDAKLGVGDAAAAFAAFEESLAIRRHLVELDASNTGWQWDLAVSLERIGDRKRASGDSPGALVAYEEELSIYRHLMQINQDNTDWLGEMSICLIRVGDTKLDVGDRAAALAAYEESLAHRRQLVEIDRSNSGWQWDLAVSLERIGDMKNDSGDSAGALALYEQELAIYRHLMEVNEHNTAWQRDLSVSLIRIGDAKRSAKDDAAALAAFNESLVIRRHLVETNKDNPGWQWDLAVSLERVGDMKQDSGDSAGALAAYEEEADISRKLVAIDNSNLDWQSSLSFALARVGDVKRGSGDAAGALAAFEEAAAARRHIFAMNPSDTNSQDQLSVVLNKIGHVKRDSGDASGALEAYEEDLAISRRLAERDSSNPAWQEGMAFTLTDIGNLKLDSGDNAGAAEAYEEAVTIRRQLAQADSGNAARMWDLSTALEKFGNAKLEYGDDVAAIAAYREALGIDRGLAEKDPNNSDWQTAPVWDLYDIARASSGKDMEAALDEAFALLESLGKNGGLSSTQEELKGKLQALRDGSVATDGN